jgi:hypothetical protein
VFHEGLEVCLDPGPAAGIRSSDGECGGDHGASPSEGWFSRSAGVRAGGV